MAKIGKTRIDIEKLTYFGTTLAVPFCINTYIKLSKWPVEVRVLTSLPHYDTSTLFPMFKVEVDFDTIPHNMSMTMATYGPDPSAKAAVAQELSKIGLSLHNLNISSLKEAEKKHATIVAALAKL
jgi:hypothetical protein